MARDAIPTWFFVLVVVRSSGRFLLVHERKHGQGFYLPAGRVEPGESLIDAAKRETMEETGIPIVIEHVLRIEHSPQPGGSARVRVIFVARPLDARPPKSIPDEESLGAGWFTLEELDRLPLRGREVKEIFAHVATGGALYPLDLLTHEGARYRLG
jgi:8-oxo-dGTP pyrophosphatase MutT (NUDIX family)